MVPVWPIEGEPDIHDHQGACGRLFHGDHPWGIADCPARDRRRILEYPTMGGAWVLFPVGGSRGFDPRDGAATLTTYIAQVAMGDVPRHSLAYQSLFAVGLSLFLLTLAFNVLGYWIRHRFGELSR